MPYRRSHRARKERKKVPEGDALEENEHARPTDLPPWGRASPAEDVTVFPNIVSARSDRV